MIRVLDIAHIHSPERDECKDFFEALSQSFDEELFKQTCVTSIIWYRWATTHKTIIRRLFVPYIFYAVIFGAYVVNLKFINGDEPAGPISISV